MTGVSSYSQITILPPNLGFSQACASEGFNTYEFTFSFYPVQNLGPTNEFIVELSDASGNFSAPTPVATLTNSSSPVSGNFALPENTAGENYRIRIRSTDPVQVSDPSNYFSAYYAIHNEPYSINNYTSEVNLCEGETYLLEIDDTGTPASPLYYPFLTYIWYKDFIEIPNENGPSIEVSEPGSYYSIVDYGTCVMNSYSNIVTVDVATSITPVINTSDGSTIICLPQGKILSSDIQSSNYTYTWYKDGQPIPNSNNPTYTAFEEGSYFVEINDLGCSFFSNTIVLEVDDYQLTLDNNQDQLLIPGDTLTINASTTAQTYTVQWYKDGIALSGENQLQLTINQPGTYKIIVSQSAPCATDKEADVTMVFPDSFNLTVDTGPFYEGCTSTNADLLITQFEAVSSIETLDLLGTSPNFDYQWFKDGNIISGANNNAYFVSDASENGIYKLEVTVPDFGTVTSNNVAVNLSIGTVIITNQEPLCEGQTTELISTISNPSYNYQWFKDGNPIAGATSETYTATDEGDYSLTVTKGSCSTQSNILTLTFGNIIVTSTTPDNNVILPGESKQINIDTNALQPTYEWYKDGIIIPNATTSSLTVTDAGVYKVIVVQTQDCLIETEKEFTFSFPTDYIIAIEKDPDYNECTSESLEISLTVFEAITPNGNVDVLNNPNISYVSQWYKDGNAITNSNENTITLTDPSQNGVYKLELTITGFGTVESNGIIANLDVNTPLVITTNGLLCENNPQVDINSSIVDPSFSYSWYKNGILFETGNQATITVTTEGNYSLIIDTGNCTKESNTLVIEESTINIEANVPLSSTLIPGSTMELSVTSNAIQPNYNWYKDNQLINGATTNTLTIDQSGVYKVVVTQTIGCIIEEELELTVQYPESFTLVIAPDATYNECKSTSTTLAVSEFYAETEEGIIDLLNNPYRYDFQWYKNDVLITGATDLTLNVGDYTENGRYKLEVIIPDFDTIRSNTLDIKLAFLDSVTIESDGILCESNSEVHLYTTTTSTEYTYAWYAVGENTVLGTDPELYVQEEGSYYLVISFEGCDIISNTETITKLDSSVVTLDYPDEIDLLEGTTITITADGADSYTWYFNSEVASTSSEIEISEPGTYILIALVGNCEVTKEIIVTEIENKAVAIPNVVTLNGDGINEHWGLPNKYVGKENIEVIIYGPNGEVVFRDQNYMNNWPESSFEFSKKQPVYYYTILEDNVIVKKGSITIIR